MVYATHRLVKGRKVPSAYQRLRARLADDHAGAIRFVELDVSFQGWIAHVAHADTWSMRRAVQDWLPICHASTFPQGHIALDGGVIVCQFDLVDCTRHT